MTLLSLRQLQSIPQFSNRASGTWRRLWLRFRQHHSGVIGLFLLVILVIVAVGAPVIANHDPLKQNLRLALHPPNSEYWFGTDEFGRDIFSRIVYGAIISLEVGIMVVVLSGVIGVTLGLIAGFYGGWLDSLISRAIDILLAFPGLLLAIAVVTVLGPSLVNALLAVSFGNIPRYTRVTRAAVLAQKENEYVDSARAVGASNARIIIKHVLPNIFAPVAVIASLGVGIAILTTASLSFLGLGAQPPEPEWGAMLSTGRSYIRRAWWVTVFPGFAIMTTVLGINLFGDALRDVLDPKTSR